MVSDEKSSDLSNPPLKKQKEHLPENEIEKLMEQSQAFQFLNDEEDLYTPTDIKEKY